MNSGIYKIINVENLKFYIGSACNLIRREYEHFNLLKQNKHYNKYLQRAYNKNPKAFKFIKLTNCPREYLIKMEQWFLDSMKPEYNLLPNAHSMLGFKFSKKTKELKSNQTKAQIIRQKQNRVTNSKLKLTIDNVADIKKMIAFNISGRKISEQFKVAVTTISAIKNKETWSEIPDYIVSDNEKHLINRTNQFSRLQKLTENQRNEVINRVLAGESHLNVSKDYQITKSGVGGIMRSYKKFGK